MIDWLHGGSIPFKPDLTGNCPAELAKARDKIQKARAALSVLRWELVQIGENQLASAAARVCEELGHG